VPLLDRAAEIALERASLCARDLAGNVDCWGDPAFGRLGSNDATVVHTTPVAGGATDLGIGVSTCARLSSGAVTCWGLTGATSGSSGALCPLPFGDPVRAAP
jgi:hypothetical protein